MIHSCMRLKIYLEAIKEKSLNQRVNIKGMDTCFSESSFWQVTHNISKVFCCCNLSFFRDTLHSPYWKIGHNNSEFSRIIIEYSSHHRVVYKEILWPAKISDICYIMMFYASFYIFNKKVWPIIWEVLKLNLWTIHIFVFCNLSSELCKIWMRYNSFFHNIIHYALTLTLSQRREGTSCKRYKICSLFFPMGERIQD